MSIFDYEIEFWLVLLFYVLLSLFVFVSLLKIEIKWSLTCYDLLELSMEVVVAIMPN